MSGEQLKTNSPQRICFIIPQFGAFPSYIKCFIYTAGYSATIADFYIFTDQPFITEPSAPNVIFKSMTLKDINDLCNEKLQVKTVIANAYKMCDLRPMYGLLFEDYIHNYKYWGYCDYDMILGDIQSMLNKYDFEKYDIFSVQDTFSSGPFLLYRNVDKVNRFFTHSPSWKDVVTSPRHSAFDERGHDNRICSLTHLMKNDELLKALDIKVSMKKLITEWITNETVFFDDGKLTILPENQSIYLFHFILFKKRKLFNQQFPEKIKSFTFTETGFHTGNKIGFLNGLFVSFIGRCWRRVKKKYTQVKRTKSWLDPTYMPFSKLPPAPPWQEPIAFDENKALNPT